MQDDLEQTLATIVKMAPELAKHCQSVTVGEVTLVLHPAPAEIKLDTKVVEDKPISPLDDPKTYGWEEGVPGFKDPRKGRQS